MKYTLTYSQEAVRDDWLYALVGRVTDESGTPVFQDELAYEHTPEALAEMCQRMLPGLVGSHEMKSGQSWRTFRLP